MDKEIWRDIEGYEGLYQVSNMGRVRSLDRTINYKNGRKIFWEGRVLKLNTHHKGYLKACLMKKSVQKYKFVHRLVAVAFILNPENKTQVNHIDGNKKNNVVTNLEWVTASENVQHAFDTGLEQVAKGEENARAKVTNLQAKEIRREYTLRSNKNNMSALARKYKLSLNNICDIIYNKTYFDSAYTPPSKRPLKRLNQEQADIIRKIYIPRDAEFGQCALARKYGVTQGTIENIIHNKTYKK